MSSMTAAAWVQGVGTLLAFGAVVLIWWDGLRRARRTAVREQAEQIAMWVTSEGSLVYVNASRLPVTQVYLRTVEAAAAYHPSAGPDQRWEVEALPPATTATDTRARPFDRHSNRSNPPRTPGRIFHLDYTDARGQRWRRGPDGVLRTIAPLKLTVSC